MTEQRSLKQLVRTRMGETGETYSKARRHLLTKNQSGLELISTILSGDPGNKSFPTALGAFPATNPHLGRFLLGRSWDRIIASEKGLSTLILGPSASVQIDTLLASNLQAWDGPAVAVSVGRKLIDQTIITRMKMGPIYVYDPTEAVGNPAGKGFRTCTFSPLRACFEKGMPAHSTWNASWKAASAIVAGIHNRTDQDWTYWIESAKRLLTPLFLAASISSRSLDEVIAWINQAELITPLTILETAQQAIKEKLEKVETRTIHPPAPIPSDVNLALETILGWDPNPGTFRPSHDDVNIAIESLLSIDKRPEKERAVIFNVCQSIFAIFAETSIKNSTKTDSFDAQDLLKNRGTLYIVAPEENPERLAGLFVSIVDTVLRAAKLPVARYQAEILDPQLGLFLDQPVSLCPHPELAEIAEKGGALGLYLMATLPEVPALERHYGAKQAALILKSFKIKLVLSGLTEPESIKAVCAWIDQSHQLNLGYTATLLTGLPGDSAILIRSGLRAETIKLLISGNKPDTFTTKTMPTISLSELNQALYPPA